MFLRHIGKVELRPQGGNKDLGRWGGTLEWETSVGQWSETLEWDSHVCFFNILNYTVFSLSELQEVQTCVKIGSSSEAVVRRF